METYAWEIPVAVLLLILGIVLVFCEVFIPSLGLLGVLAAASFVGSIALAFQVSAVAGWVFAGSTIVIVPLAIRYGLKVFPGTQWGKRVILAPDPTLSGTGARGLDALVGAQGRVISPLRPSGTAIIDGRRLDVVTEGLMIEKGRPVRVIRVEGNRVVVGPVHADRQHETGARGGPGGTDAL